MLGGGLEPDGRPTAATLARADAAAELATRRNVAIVVSGSHGNGRRPPRTEAALMAERIAARGIAADRIFLEDGSRDTVSNAAFVAERYLASVEPRRIILVTSAFHMPRALATFALVLGERWPIEAHPVADTPPASGDRAADERRYMERTQVLLEGFEPGNITAIAAHVRASLPQRVRDD